MRGTWRKVQWSKARAVGTPLRKRQLRRNGATQLINAHYDRPALQDFRKELGGVREAPFILAVETGRWFQRCHEELATTIKPLNGHSLILEFAHMMRYPSHNGTEERNARWATTFIQNKPKTIKDAKLDAREAITAVKTTLKSRRGRLTLPKYDRPPRSKQEAEQRAQDLWDVRHAVYDVNEIVNECIEQVDDYERAHNGSIRYKRRAEKYQQHTKPYRYSLESAAHIRALANLLILGGAFFKGMRNPGAFTQIYTNMEVGDRRELGRWHLPGMHRYDAQRRECIPCGSHGYEALEAVCLPGVIPECPRECFGDRPVDPKKARRYDLLLENWRRQVSSAGKNIELRLHRFCHDPEQRVFDTPAFYLNDAFELDLTETVFARWGDWFASWLWDSLDVIRSRSDRPNDVLQQVRIHFNPYKAKAYEKLEEKPALDGRAEFYRKPYRRQFSPELLKLSRAAITEALNPPAAPHGTLLIDWDDTADDSEEELRLRVRLYEAGMISWHPLWSVTAEEAAEQINRQDYQQVRQVLHAMVSVLLIRWRKKAYNGVGRRYFADSFHIVRNDILTRRLIRGPPC